MKTQTLYEILAVISLEPQGSVQRFLGFLSGMDLASVKIRKLMISSKFQENGYVIFGGGLGVRIA